MSIKRDIREYVTGILIQHGMNKAQALVDRYNEAVSRVGPVVTYVFESHIGSCSDSFSVVVPLMRVMFDGGYPLPASITGHFLEFSSNEILAEQKLLASTADADSQAWERVPMPSVEVLEWEGAEPWPIGVRVGRKTVAIFYPQISEAQVTLKAGDQK